MFADEQGVIKGDLARELAREFGVEASVFERDYLLNAVVWAFKGDVATGYRHYIADGRANAEQIKEVISSIAGIALRKRKLTPARSQCSTSPAATDVSAAISRTFCRSRICRRGRSS